ncbi:MAG: 3D domain-containing protein [Pyrinomonadaceae bacterium]
MKNPARGYVLLGIFALIGIISFYFQPKVEAKSAFQTAIDSQENLQQQITQENNPTTQQTENQQPEIQQNNEADSDANSEIVSEFRSFRATAYCLKGRTATGGSVRRGIVAADPRILPLGTRIQLNAGSYSGTYTVADTGGAVKGRILDIWVPNCAEAIRFGRKTVKVSVLGKRTKNSS